MKWRKIVPYEEVESHATSRSGEGKPDDGVAAPVVVSEKSPDPSSNRWLRCWTRHSPTNYSMVSNRGWGAVLATKELRHPSRRLLSTCVSVVSCCLHSIATPGIWARIDRLCELFTKTAPHARS